jgi:hypothetical protein
MNFMPFKASSRWLGPPALAAYKDPNDYYLSPARSTEGAMQVTHRSPLLGVALLRLELLLPASHGS